MGLFRAIHMPPPALVESPPAIVEHRPAVVEPPPAFVEPPPAFVDPPSTVTELSPAVVEPPSIFADPSPQVSNDEILPETSQTEAEMVLDSEILEILGTDPTQTNKFGKDLQKDLAIRFEHCATVGLSKDDRKQLADRYLIPNNCKLINPPTLNPETKAALSEMVVKKDKAIEAKQRVLASAISSLGEAITFLLSSKESTKNTDLLRLLMDSGKLLCDCQHSDSVTRRNFIIYSVKKEMRESLQNTNIDSSLFGNNLTETLKTAKAINKSGAELKVTTASKAANVKKHPVTNSKNWKNLNQFRKPPAKTKDATSAPPMKNQRGSSSAQSQAHRPSHSRR
ncbi:hypothetical protein NE865_05528 [Phthorimaea operculella]|nr:hypothetical protein NE865_05528 [Phthorimaea operculella]